MWEQLKRIVKPNGAICLFGSEPFSSALRMSNLKMFKYDWIWEKNNGTNFLNVKYQPFKVNENIHIFSQMSSTYSKNGMMKYYPQKTLGHNPYKASHRKNRLYSFHSNVNSKKPTINTDGSRYPKTIQRFNIERGLHPTQKPVPLLEYLIKTYTLEGETVLDFTMGSGSTGVASKNLNRNFIGIEKDEKYFKIAHDRIHSHCKQSVQLEAFA